MKIEFIRHSGPNPRWTFGKLTLVAAAVAVLGTGCASPPRAWNVAITKRTPATIEVDLIGVNKLDKPNWVSYPMSNYWQPADQQRSQANKRSFENLKPNQPAILEKNDPIWQEWFARGDNELLVLAHLPGNPPDEARRRFLPLRKKDWDAKNDTLEIEIRETGIFPVTPPK